MPAMSGRSSAYSSMDALVAASTASSPTSNGSYHAGAYQYGRSGENGNFGGMQGQPSTSSQPQTPPPWRPVLRKACDDCHAIKVRCVPLPGQERPDDEHHRSVPCQRCHRLGIRCNFSPKEIVLKRKRRSKKDEPTTTGSYIAVAADETRSDAIASARPSSDKQPASTTLAAAPFLGAKSGAASPGPSYSWPAPPTIPDLEADQWEAWFRTLGTTASTSHQIHANQFDPAGLRAELGPPPPPPAMPSTEDASKAFMDACLDSFSVGPYSQSIPATAPDACDWAQPPLDDHEMLSRPSRAPAAQHLIDMSLPSGGARASEPARAHGTDTLTGKQEPLTTAATGQEDTSGPNQWAIESRLSAVCVEFSTALDLCDPLRSSGLSEGTLLDSSKQPRQFAMGNAGIDEATRAEGERRLLSIFARAEELWAEITAKGFERVQKIDSIIREHQQQKNGAKSQHSDGKDSNKGSQPNDQRNSDLSGTGEPGDRSGEAAGVGENGASSGAANPRHGLAPGTFVQPLSTAASMLALSLSFHMLDALRVLARVLDDTDRLRDQDKNKTASTTELRGAATESAGVDVAFDSSAARQREQLGVLLSSITPQHSSRLPAPLLEPMLRSVHEHYTTCLQTHLSRVILHSRHWHDSGEGRGPGPHHFCPVQVQGIRVMKELEDMKAGIEQRRKRRAMREAQHLEAMAAQASHS